jgi:hypothetical protein
MKDKDPSLINLGGRDNHIWTYPLNYVMYSKEVLKRKTGKEGK